MKRLGLFALWSLLRTLSHVRPKLVIPAPNGVAYMTRWHLSPGHLEPRPGTLPTWVVAPWWAALCRRFNVDADLVALHAIHMSDPDRGLHNHPYKRFRSLILRGSGYFEHRIRGDVETWYVFRPGKWNHVEGADVYHALYLLGETFPTWTLMVAGPKHGKGWSFQDVNGAKRDRMMCQ